MKIPKQYTDPKNLNCAELYDLLHDVFVQYDEYHREGFHVMVHKFANDDFYNMYYVAKKYLQHKNDCNN